VVPDIRAFFFRKSVEKIQVSVIRITGILHEDVFTFMTISRRILLRMRNVSNKSCRGNQNTFYAQQLFFLPKIVPFVIMSKNTRSPPHRDKHIPGVTEDKNKPESVQLVSEPRCKPGTPLIHSCTTLHQDDVIIKITVSDKNFWRLLLC
jgi:hypothetical protein